MLAAIVFTMSFPVCFALSMGLIVACASSVPSNEGDKSVVRSQVRAWQVTSEQLDELIESGFALTEDLDDLTQYSPAVASAAEADNRTSQALVMAVPIIVVASGLAGGGMLVLAPKVAPGLSLAPLPNEVDIPIDFQTWHLSVRLSLSLLLRSLSPTVRSEHDLLGPLRSEAQKEQERLDPSLQGAAVEAVASSRAEEADEGRCEAMRQIEEHLPITSVPCGDNRHCATVYVCIEDGELLLSTDSILTLFADDESPLSDVHIEIRLLPESDENLWIVLEDTLDAAVWDNIQTTVGPGQHARIVHRATRFELEMGLLPQSQKHSRPEYKLYSSRSAG